MRRCLTDLLTHPIYTGHICSERYGINWLKAQHEPLITLETFDKVQERRAGTAKAPKRKNIGDHFALRGIAVCDCCEVPLRSSFTICNGAGVVVAQFYGGGAEARARDAIGTTVLLSVAISAGGFALVVTLSGPLAAWSSDDPAIQALALEYLIPASAMVLPYAAAFGLAVGLRSVGRPGLATAAAVVGLSANVLLNWVLIFGNLGAPALGVQGAAYASVLSFGIEAVVVAICAVALFDRRLFAPARLPGYLNADTMRKVLRVGLPIAAGSVIWAVGIFMYSVVTAQAGPEALAVLGLVTPVESMAIAIMIGLSSTANVIVGQQLGRSNFRGAVVDATALVAWTVLIALVVGVALWLAKPALLWLYGGAGASVLAVTDDVFDVLACVLVIRAINVTLVVGVLRAGADTISPIVMDVSAQWLVAIPLTAAAVLWLGLPFPWVFLAINAEEMARLGMALWRVTRFGWLRRIRA
ncbi:MATE family efflux transporter [Roseobacter cerasinus]|uniref:MATE family efflux transporter n=1 Tax=Roseobacter cerasinus TaxID=2602289 RepID=A0A640VS28_9RHOB|nr:MATE family efflux transporter [Roseobacter cerasinus]GFE49016.1 MATE family efflux transporter [Roseobacter cerasinus]